MSANFTGVTFPNQKVTPANDAVIRRAIFDDGILTGCDLSYSGSTLTMTAGQLMICGRQIIHPSSQNWAVTEATSGYARLVLTIDVTRTSTKDTFDQVVDEIQYATDANGFTDLTTADINATGTRYQVAVCVVSLGPGGITGIVSKLDMTEGGGAGGILTVMVSPGELVTVSNGDKSQAKAADASGAAVFKGLKAGTWTVSVTRNGKPTAKTVIVVTDYSVSIPLSGAATYLYKSGEPDSGIWSTYDPSYSDLALAYGTNLVFTVPARTADFGNRANMYTATTDLAEFNTLEFRLKNTKTVKIGIASSLGEDDNSWISYVSVPANSEFAPCVIDVSAISSGIVAVRYDGSIAAGGCTVTFENITLI